MSEILPGLFIGSKKDALDIEWIRSENITSVLNVAKSTFDINYDDPNIEVMKIPLEDHPTENIDLELDIGYSFINLTRLSNRNILIHCAAGISRSATFLIYYLMKKYKMSLEDALNLAREKRKKIRPNGGFLNVLYERQNSISGINF